MAQSIEEKSVVGVCGSQARVYGALDRFSGVRPLMRIVDFPHKGAALLFAQEFEEEKKPAQNKIK